MIRLDKSRFRNAEEALRFYFRVRELLHSGRPRRLVPDELPSAACSHAANAVDDYQCIGWCMRGLSETDLWLLSVLYGPGFFGAHRVTMAQACSAGRVAFPRREFKVRELGQVHRHALFVVRNRLRGLGLVPVFRCSESADNSRRRADHPCPQIGDVSA